MDDLAYLVAESNAAWLAGRGDGRFQRYERFYRSEREKQAAAFELEQVNEAYPDWVGSQPPRVIGMLARPWFGKVLVALTCMYVGAEVVPTVSSAMPYKSTALLCAVFVGLRIFHWKRRRAR
ncbi:hypothetical protein QHI69_37010 [Burkholderia gladioli pv. gladioli]|uniref:Uncharacterized protein n=1 Tax=Burkholderia gladioli TaxID=28095 RepID=A0AAW3F6R5_BURGA|nr:hypothetical protein [Burkholderia gladioli]AJW93779.1 hypothetical protein BM43_7312 [Burkholderia gladioli]ASD84680.1 hypothetical protein CEJ98_37615 [Burkholderia gladioli pv. gladioli]AWY49800.1 hypothetical protein A8H28_00610 [Burkholderia gladioli pv. gladioli]KGC16529.1 hypothetical protein DM48_3318 [Burkholderia gladioli]MDJ1167528.1 hypothetical protein [Burkholderia gladioli pv. gladioli]